MSINTKFIQNIDITEIEHIHDTHYVIRFGDTHYLKIYLSPETYCCERTGMYVNYNKSPAFLNTIPSLVGASLTGISVSDSKTHDNATGYYSSVEKHIVLFTSIGNVFITAYNEHNGYYPHEFETDIKTPEINSCLQQRI